MKVPFFHRRPEEITETTNAEAAPIVPRGMRRVADATPLVPKAPTEPPPVGERFLAAPDTLPVAFEAGLVAHVYRLFPTARVTTFWDFRWEEGVFSLLLAEAAGVVGLMHVEIAARAAFAAALVRAGKDGSSEDILRAVHAALFRTFRGKAGAKAVVLRVAATKGKFDLCNAGFEGVLKPQPPATDKKSRTGPVALPKGDTAGLKETVELRSFTPDAGVQERLVLVTDSVFRAVTRDRRTLGLPKLGELAQAHLGQGAEAAHREFTGWLEKNAAEAPGAGFVFSVDWAKQRTEATEPSISLNLLNEKTGQTLLHNLERTRLEGELAAARESYLYEDREIKVLDDEGETKK